jgi:starch phosphorylase
MRPIKTLTVRPALPAELTRLEELAHNLWWCWNQDAIDLFERIDRDLWARTGHNPVRVLGAADHDRLAELGADDGFKAHLERVLDRLDGYMRAERTWWSHQEKEAPGGVGYFSFEFGIHECLPLYSGGMGLLAGDHIRSASDLGVPLSGVSLLYQEGYFRQYLNADGWQLERYYENDFHTMPLRLERGRDDKPLKIAVEYPGRSCQAQIWRLQVGRAPLFLLDANLPENDPADRQVTRRLYQGDDDMRIRQEILLGVGGVRALAAVGAEPTVCHMNEGHAAFLGVERTRRLMKARNLSFHEARELAAAGHVFTTHTPVAAGIDIFTPDLIDRYFGPQYGELGISRDEFLGLGRQNPFDPNERFSMAVLAIRMADKVNGVSRLHGEVSRRMWRAVWPEVPEAEVPIGSVTNGVHAAFWTAGSEVAPVYDRYLGPGWREQPEDADVWQEAYQIPSEELWRAHERNRERLIAFVRDRLRRQALDRGAAPSEVAQAGDLLDPSALTIGFARRFATYKRALLMFKDADRLARIMGDRSRRVQFVVAGKAHPQDLQGREVIRELIHRARRDEFSSRIIFVENYDVEVARQLVQGVDLWLTNPRRPLEASGTSGMKVALNGGLNVSVLDGWWVEAYRPELGWAIGRGEEYQDLEYQDQIESRALYDLLEKEIVPLFYDRGPDDLPRGWIGRMKASIANIGPFFNTHRMVQEYATTAYLPGAQRFARLGADGARPARDLAAWKQRMWASWGDVRVVAVDTPPTEEVSVGAEVPVTAVVHLGSLTPRDVRVELYAGRIDAAGEILPDTRVTLAPDGASRDGVVRFSGTLRLEASGKRGYTVRVLPQHEALPPRMEPGLIRWAVS